MPPRFGEDHVQSLPFFNRGAGKMPALNLCKICVKKKERPAKLAAFLLSFSSSGRRWGKILANINKYPSKSAGKLKYLYDFFA